MDMFTIDDDQMRLLARDEDTLGPMLLTLAFTNSLNDEAGVNVPTRPGWIRCDPGEVAAGVYGEATMQGYTQEGSGIVLTLALIDDVVAMHAEGHGWAIEAEHRYAGWMPSGAGRGLGMFGRRYENMHAEEPWMLPGNPEYDEDRDPTVFGPDGVMRIDGRAPMRSVAPMSQDLEALLPAWLKPGYDWERAIVADPGNTLSRIHILAAPLGIAWSNVRHEDRPTHAMMNRIEQALGIETTEPSDNPEHRMVHRLTLGLRIAAAEAAVVGRRP